MVNVFAVPVFFICFRESLETSIIVSVLLAFVKQTMGPDKDPTIYKKLRKQIWIGVAIGLFICLCIGGAFIAVFYTVGQNYFGNTEDAWEGAFSIVAALIISLMGAALLRISKLQDKWRIKIAKALEARREGHHVDKGRFKKWCEKYAMFILPFITVLREGLEAVVFIGGVSLGFPAEAFPIPVIVGLICGTLIGVIIFYGGNRAPLQVFLVVSTCFLYLVGAGLFSRGVWGLEQNYWNHATGGDAAETGSGPGSYDINISVWHVNCCNPEVNGGGGWGIFNALLGWQNSATIGSVLSYNMYWLAVIVGFLLLRYNETRGGFPFIKRKKHRDVSPNGDSEVDEIETEKTVVQRSRTVESNSNSE